MQRLRNWFIHLPTVTRRVFIAVSGIALAFLVFSLLSIKDLLAMTTLNQYITNPVPLVIFLLGVLASFIALQGKPRSAAYLMIISLAVGLILIDVFAEGGSYSTIAELLIIILPIFIALQGLSEREFIWVVILSIVARSILHIITVSRISSFLVSGVTSTETLANWISIAIIVVFGLYIAVNLNNYPFRTKLVLVLGILVIVPTQIISNISQRNLQDNLIAQANDKLVISSNQLAGTISSFVQTSLDSVRTEAQTPAFQALMAERTKYASITSIVLMWGSPEDTAAHATLEAMMKRDPINIISVKLIDYTGTVQESTSIDEIGDVVSEENYFYIPFSNGLPNMTPVFLDDKGNSILHMSAPVRSLSNEIVGVLDITYSASVFQQVIVRSRTQIGTNVSAMLLDQNNIILAHSSSPELLYKIVNPPADNTYKTLINQHRLPDLKPEQFSIQMSGLTEGLAYLDFAQYFSGYLSAENLDLITRNTVLDEAGASLIPSLNWHVVTYTPQSDLFIPVQQQTLRLVWISIAISLLGILVALGLTQVLVAPIMTLTTVSEKVAAGDISVTAPVHTQDEIGSLSHSFNAMTEQIRGLVGGLEQRVNERTQALERRAVQLQAAADVGSTVARVRNVDLLLRLVARLISNRFGFYHVGIFLIDELGEYAVLRATNSEGGLKMINRQHKLKIGEVGIVGNVAATGQPRIALSVGKDAVFFSNPDLPLTQSEMALPLIAGGKILGVLDIQSTEVNAFSEEDVATLKVLADQISVAIENARLFAESQSALETARRATGDISMRGWQALLEARQATQGYISLAEDHLSSVSGDPSPEFLQAIQNGKPVLTNNDTTLHLPITVRGQAIGAIRMDKKNKGEHWTTVDINMASAFTEQLGNALEGARLYADISERAEREAVISDIASKIGASIQIDTILRTSVEELGKALSDSEVIIQMGAASPLGAKNE